MKYCTMCTRYGGKRQEAYYIAKHDAHGLAMHSRETCPSIDGKLAWLCTCCAGALLDRFGGRWIVIADNGQKTIVNGARV